MSAHTAPFHAPASLSTTPRARARAATVALWLLQIALAALLLMAGASKLAGAPAMIQLFDAVGVGQWFRYVTGALEVTGAILLLVPAVASLGALLLAGVMAGAVMTHVFILHSAPAPAPFLVTALIILYVRRQELVRWAARLRR